MKILIEIETMSHAVIMREIRRDSAEQEVPFTIAAGTPRQACKELQLRLQDVMFTEEGERRP